MGAGRPTSQQADIEKLKKIYESSPNMLDIRPIMAVTMKACKATYREIGDVFGISRQQSETIVLNAEKEIV